MGARLWRIAWLIFLIGQGSLAAAWWWLAPSGFGPGHPRFWLNGVAAPTVAILALATLWALRGERWGPLRLLLPGWPAAWTGMALVLSCIFPITMAGLRLIPPAIAVAMGLASIRPLWAYCRARRGPSRVLLVAWTAAWVAMALVLVFAIPTTMAGPALVPFVFAVAMGLAAIRPWRIGAIDRRGFGGLAATVCGSALFGAALAAALNPPPVDTHPLDVSIATVGLSDGERGDIRPVGVRLDSRTMIQPSDGSLVARILPLTIHLEPFLTFLSRSPDGSPVVLVPESERAGPDRRLRDGGRLGDGSCWLAYDTPGQGPATLRAAVEPDDGAIVLEAATRLDRPVFSHLNAYCDIEIRGHRRLALEFSPCPGALIEVRHFGYPTGSPARFAFVSADRTFLVVEASGGEKGPFRTLARGRLDPGQALTITLHDEDRAIARLSLEDFVAQADTTPSPTAGWGVPVNAIEFSLAGEAPSSPASIFITLAGTSVGRGWDCVGHRSGTYRNRIRLEPAGHTKSFTPF